MALFQFNPPLLACAALLLLGSVGGALLAALIAPMSSATPLRRFGWSALRLLFGLGVVAALIGFYVAL